MDNHPNKIIMFGPAFGHNIKPFLNFFSTTNNHVMLFVYSGKIDEENKKIKTITFFKLSKSYSVLKSLIKEIKQADIIWHQGGYNVFELLLIYLFKQKKTLFVINVWGEHVPNVASGKTIKGKIYKFFYNKCDVISCLWYGTKKILDNFIDPKKIKVLLWGLENSYFSDEQQELCQFTKEFIEQIPEDKTIFFYPKSFTEASNHDGIIEASKIIREKGVNDFVVYFWTGNISRGDYEKTSKEKIEFYKLSENVKVIYHDFLPFYDIINIWNYVDVGLQIVKNDQLSTTFLEPLMLKKEIIVSDIYPYQKMKECFSEMELTLTKNDPESIAQSMKGFIEGNRTSETILENRKKVIEKEFNFEKNIPKMLDYYQDILKQKSLTN